MTQDTRSWSASPAAPLPSAATGYPEPVEHLHFDRRSREWRSHPELTAAAGGRITAGPIVDDGVRQ